MSNHTPFFQPCLIGGTGRSGTTIFKKIISQHPQVAYAPEGRFTVDPDGLVDFYQTFSNQWSPYLFDRRVKRLKKMLYALGKHRMFMRVYSHVMSKYKIERSLAFRVSSKYPGIAFEKYSPNFLQYVDELIDALTLHTYKGQWVGCHFLEAKKLHFSPEFEPQKLAQLLGDFWRKVIADTCNHKDATFYVEDNTWNILFYDRILELLPEAKMVHVVRDPRDVVASYVTMGWAPSKPLYAAKWYKSLMRKWLSIREQLPPESYMEIKLEELVRDPKETISSACDFWGLEWNDAFMRIKLNKAHSGRWKEEFSAQQIQVITREIETEIAALGYQ